MMKKVMSKNKGVTLVSLTIVITVLLILTGVIIYNVRDSLGVGNLQEMQNDVENLREMVNNYYAENGKIPAKLKYTNEENIERIENSGVISENIDIGDFYIIDLKELENLTLNYGEDYKNISDATTEDEASQYEDIYIINETSQNVFYVAGIQLDNEMFYTDYTSEDVDKVAINLRYFDGVKIPEGFYYVGGTKDEGLVISDVQGDDLDNSKQGNQFVWVPVENFDDFKREHFGTEEQKWWSGTFVSDELSTGNFYELTSDGIMEDTEVEKMYKSVKENKGFYVGRYEAGTTASSGTGKRGEVVSKKGANVYNNIGWSDSNDMTDETGGAVEVARGMYTEEKGDSVTSTLIYGVQWDAIMRWMQDVPNQTGGKYVQDSIGMGWYSYNVSGNETHRTGIDVDGGKNKVKNIYDLAGNVFEWTMECSYTYGRAIRGGSYNHLGSTNPTSYRSDGYPSNSSPRIGFRVALYINLEEKWSPTYDEEGTYTDKNGDTAYIPKGFQVSEENGKNTIDEGLVIRNATTDDRYVWIEVPKSVFVTAASRTDYEHIEEDLQEYTKEYKEGNEDYSDTWYEGCGIASEREYNDLKNAMYSSIFVNGGFYISQYEIGAETYVTASDNGAREPVSKEGMYPYNYVTVAQAQKLATDMDSGEKTSSLMFGIQWDLVMKFLETKGVSVADLKEDSSSWGNYRNVEFPVAEGNKYVIYNNTIVENWEDTSENYTKAAYEIAGNGVLLSTGATERNMKMNIYDISGNVYESTLEKSTNIDNMLIARGGSFNRIGSEYSSCKRSVGNQFNSDCRTGFRSTIF